tara:strand:+ start:356 stop:1336 length:981 start_codon:yes stop_codon:yes gene_type:complete
MPTLLEQAIIDAEELREAALKNAESTILEKYNNEVKNVVETLLEQEEEMEMMGAMEEPAFAAAEEEEMCPCPDKEEEEMVSFSLEDLKNMADDLEGTSVMGEPESQEDLMTGLGMEPDDEDETLPLQEEFELTEEDVELDEEMIKELVEELVVDVMPVKTGWLATPQGEMQYAEELELARLAGTEAQEQMKALKDAHDRLTITNESLTSDNRKLVGGILALKEKVEETLLENAKLLYMNQALNSASLNERQRSNVVESIRKADSVEEAKVIYETLQSAAGDSTRRKPKSLSEAISRPSSTLPRRRKERAQGDSVAKDRFQILAGLK